MDFSITGAYGTPGQNETLDAAMSGGQDYTLDPVYSDPIFSRAISPTINTQATAPSVLTKVKNWFLGTFHFSSADASTNADWQGPVQQGQVGSLKSTTNDNRIFSSILRYPGEVVQSIARKFNAGADTVMFAPVNATKAVGVKVSGVASGISSWFQSTMFKIVLIALVVAIGIIFIQSYVGAKAAKAAA